MDAIGIMSKKDQIRKKIVIIGGGFAGSVLAKKLEKRMPNNWDIFILSETNFVTYNPLLPEVVGASILPGHVQSPLRQILKRTKIRMVTVEKIDYESKVVYYNNNEPGELHYDQLVLASGVKANLSMLPGLREHSLPLKTVGDALFIRNRVIENLEQATIHKDPAKRKFLTTFVVIGGGFSGVETAGELNDLLKSSERYYKNINSEDCKVILIHGADRLLPELPEKLGRTTEKNFLKRNIDVRLKARTASIEHEKVVLNTGEVIEGSIIISTIGTLPHAFTQDKYLPLERGRITTQADMSVMDNIWALGDCALVPNAKDNQFCPPTAQFANRQAVHLANNIIAQVNGNETQPFSYKAIGMLASIGHNKAVAEIYGIRISGLVAFLIWRAIYLVKVPTLARKVRLFLEWTWSMFFPPDIAHFGFKRTKKD